MKYAVIILAVLLASASSASIGKRQIDLLGELAAEAGKILVCEGKLNAEDCTQCCNDSTWYFDFEKSTCITACKILPAKTDYLTTYAPFNQQI